MRLPRSRMTMSSCPCCFSLTAAATPPKPAPTIATETFRAMGATLPPERLQLGQASVARADETLDRLFHRRHVQAPGLGHRLQIRPVARPVEHDLEDRELHRSEDRNLLALERDRPAVACGLVVQRDVVEEEVDRGLVPPQPDLALARDRLGRARGLGDAGRERAQCPLGLAGGREDVYVHVACAARVERRVREGDRAAEGVGDAGFRERAMYLDDALGQRHCDWSRGYPSAARCRTGSASARASTSARERAVRLSWAAEGSRTACSAAVTVSRAPAAARSRLRVATDGCFVPFS